ncbi:hypothetical protein A3C89_00170 [Candidatus Kaiserbacteria bacterium RIFCSPHIGHO2_02_FULL_50_50]|uniref:Yip1 domain-containing protein n=1 Tax=Candidatus Kaiserbacteria bacterium RIFCSPHIGHO2_02_FULL_50_50 TaxID=1798492 RepID=A0A1F6DE11_9BACT|nr:MAG: hypothetical protein A3C89_00170 [Candidatus Kaiserbacteria bacterium RIFCSPHIGHO2_02_FULL_50_50]OGG88681.1 MAG: hypothetical protein A3G62_02030 [Candidatus Kaiserbacteria bacterium RIFCSPLOWO2_12_FULL_50_10]
MLQGYLALLTGFANGVLMPTLIGLAFVYTVWNVFQLYIVQAAADKVSGRKAAVAYGIAAVVVLLSFWGAVNFLTTQLGAGPNQVITPDYIKK